MRRKSKALRAVCCLAAAFSVFAFSGCTDILYLFLPDSATQTYDPNEWDPHVDPNASDSQSDAQDSASDSASDSLNGGTQSGANGGSDTPVVTPTPDEPDPEKTVLYKETDDMGHQIVYYTDGTSEDLGRVTPLDFSIPAPQTQYAYTYFEKQSNGAELCAFYEDIYDVALKFHCAGKDLTKTNDHYKIAELDFSVYGLTQDEAAGVWRTVYGEYPEFFWWGNSLLLGEKKITLLADGTYAKAATRESLQTDIEEAVLDCDGYLDGTTSLVERALTIHDYVAKRTTYAYESDGVTPQDDIWAHNIIGVVNGSGVCESYAKFYDYLCGFFALDSLTVVGSALQNGSTIGHAWNLVKLGENWYNVDVTWSDGNSETLSREWFGMGSEEFSQTHAAITPTDGWGVNYQCELPTPSASALSPVRVVERAETDASAITQTQQNEAPMYASIEEIYAGMTSGNVYVAYLYPHTKVSAEGMTIAPRGARLNEAKTSETGSLTLVGAYNSYSGGYYSIGTLTAANGIELCGDLTLQDLRVEGSAFALGAHTLTTTGTAAELSIESPITGVEGSSLIAQATGWTSLSEIALYKITAQSDELRLLGGSVTYAEIDSGILRLHGTANTTIETLQFASADEQLYIDGASNATKITVGSATMEAHSYFTTLSASVFISYASAAEYPVLSVATIGSRLNLSLLLYSANVSPTALGLPLINLGTSFDYSSLTLAYTSGGAASTLNKSLFEKTENGDVCLK